MSSDNRDCQNNNSYWGVVHILQGIVSLVWHHSLPLLYLAGNVLCGGLELWLVTPPPPHTHTHIGIFCTKAHAPTKVYARKRTWYVSSHIYMSYSLVWHCGRVECGLSLCLLCDAKCISVHSGCNLSFFFLPYAVCSGGVLCLSVCLFFLFVLSVLLSVASQATVWVWCYKYCSLLCGRMCVCIRVYCALVCMCTCTCVCGRACTLALSSFLCSVYRVVAIAWTR